MNSVVNKTRQNVNRCLWSVLNFWSTLYVGGVRMIHKIGERISALRKERNMSQEELASVINVSRTTISKWETGESLPDVYNAVALANIFHITLDNLVLGGNQKTATSSYMLSLKETRQKMNLKAILVGGTGSTVFGVFLVLLKALDIKNPLAGYIYIAVLPVLMICWGYAIWNFIKIGRIGEEIKYLEKVELEHLRNK